MKLEMLDVTPLKNAIEIISELVTEATFLVKKDYVELIAMDPGVVSMVILKLMKSAFSVYQVSQEETISVNLNYLKQILKRAKKEKVTIEKTEDEKLRIEIVNGAKRTFVIPLLNLEEETRKVPELNFPVTVTLSAEDFKDAVEDSSIVSDSVTLIVNKNSFVIEGKGDLSAQRTEFSNVKIIVEDKNATYKASYSIEYLERMIKASKISAEVTIQFDNDYPVKLEYTLLDTISLTFILAPRASVD
ncbi:MAG: proliferating cell nuclear antigen (pcna) [Candidatus Woesearchaeota archaeon]